MSLKEIAGYAEVNLSVVEKFVKGGNIQSYQRKRINKVLEKSPQINHLKTVWDKIGDHSQEVKNALTAEILKGVHQAGDNFTDAIQECLSDAEKLPGFLRAVAPLLPKEAHIKGEVELRDVIENVIVDAVSEEVEEVDEEAEVMRSITIN